MIGFFPDPYPDELFYSACARYAKRLNYPNKLSAIIDLLGKKGVSATVDIPTRLNHFLSVIQTREYSAEEIINDHTLFPFYEPFITVERSKIIREEIKQDDDNRLRTRLAININQIGQPEFLRFCPICAESDRLRFGETYWHRLHQLSAVLVCPEHRCFLEDSPVLWNQRIGKVLHSAEEYITLEKPRFTYESRISDRLFLKMAEDARWLLNQSHLSLPKDELRERYYNILLKMKYAWYNGRIKATKLTSDFLAYYPREVLDELGCADKSGEFLWLARMLEKKPKFVFHHPLRHLLLLNFLNISLKDFFHNFVEFKPFAAAPYPCLNPVAPHYKKLIVKECEIKDSQDKNKNRGRPLGIFKCDCGFVYRRLGPDESNEDKFRYDSVIEYGNVWESHLGKDWENLNLSLSEIARRFQTTTLLIARHAIRLNLPMSTENTRQVEGYARHRKPRNYLSQNVEKYRADWERVIKKHPKLNRKQLLLENKFLYQWLMRNDSDWFKKHLPAPLKPDKKKDILNWEKIDEELSEKVNRVCREILNETKPTRVSITEVIKRTGNKNWLEKTDEKLPLTSNLLEELLESLEDFMLRKLKWAEEKYIQEKVMPTKNQLMCRAVIRNGTTSNSPTIQKDVIETLKRIHKHLF